MPWADKAKRSAASNDWNKRNRARVIEAKRRWRERQRKLRAIVTIIHKADERRKLTKAERKYFRKLRRNGTPLRRAQALAYGDDYL